jgi:hypothetical protein
MGKKRIWERKETAKIVGKYLRNERKNL